jgi:hypothetical protein
MAEWMRRRPSVDPEFAGAVLLSTPSVLRGAADVDDGAGTTYWHAKGLRVTTPGGTAYFHWADLESFMVFEPGMPAPVDVTSLGRSPESSVVHIQARSGATVDIVAPPPLAMEWAGVLTARLTPST